ncbi:hypothetical protein FDP41_006809 [Naegleria fowleri]|uniref:DUF4116 domain-containing protein n=1 Tax=Naegleria fowleri TaxID=5763 RepID=A0A6A5BMR1_NAEFO|nr:uncharacterized protein FDP41_006809 [Naegleria fowleri]KAF0974199.1 hypothetical protein FDP41_006809 [Naegleria fowleri]
MKVDKALLLEAVRKTPFAIRFVPPEVEFYRELAIEALKQERVLHLLWDGLRKDKKLILEAFKHDYRVLDDYKELLEDREFLLEAVKIHPIALEYAPFDVNDDPEFILECIEQNSFALSYATPEIQENTEIVAKAVKQNGFALNYCHELYQLRMESCYFGCYIPRN